MSLKLVILGVLDHHKVHPYDIKRFLKHYKWDYLFQISDAKIYYAFESLEKGGFVKVSEVVENEKTPTKTIYAITETGRAQIEKELEKVFKKDILSYKVIYPALLFFNYAKKEKLLQLLDTRCQKVKKELTRSIEQAEQSNENPSESITSLIIQNAIKHLTIEVEWLMDLQHKIQKDELQPQVSYEIEHFFSN
ncbi:PadR family transcriptional regulator [Listeria aquatica]|uniref:PadR family transcriptional regulator n=1 Tax=Listeria aquatica TaxID=1494960 RepID=UPI003F715C1D